jgi:uncharacterized protein YbjQ (UPF0145 family)
MPLAQEAVVKDHGNQPKIESFAALGQRMENVLERAKEQALRAQEMKKTAQKMRDRAVAMVNVSYRTILH